MSLDVKKIWANFQPLAADRLACGKEAWHRGETQTTRQIQPPNVISFNLKNTDSQSVKSVQINAIAEESNWTHLHVFVFGNFSLIENKGRFFFAAIADVDKYLRNQKCIVVQSVIGSQHRMIRLGSFYYHIIYWFWITSDISVKFNLDLDTFHEKSESIDQWMNNLSIYICYSHCSSFNDKCS